ncbi:MAG: type I-C CRISPR-associated protein Cas5c [Hyphomonadaceae bacterium]|jgi:CRISPR-associated protein Cas5d|nr:type I-C CRISPR-associated protein Cas5c [Hyphomonadaceae bacterium]
MSYGISLKVSGARACFTRPEMKAERISYDVITPSAARGILEAIHWKPAIRWVIDRIHVLKPIRFESIRRNEVGSKISARNVTEAMHTGTIDGLALYVDEDRQQRAATILKDVAYVIEAHFELTARAQDDDTEGKHLEMFNRRAAKGQCFHQPCLGTREFPAEFHLVEGEIPQSELPPDQRNRDLGWMLYDIDFDNDRLPMFYRPTMVDGVIDVTKFRPAEARP